MNNQGSKPIVPQNGQGTYKKPANENNNNQSKAPGKLFVISRSEAENSTDVVSGTYSINSVLVKASFDSGATYSFISSPIINSLGLVDFQVIDSTISIPTGEVIRCTKMCRDLPLKIEECVFSV